MKREMKNKMENRNTQAHGDLENVKSPPSAWTFVARLQGLRDQERTGELAALRRAAGTRLGESASAMQQFYRFLPSQVTKPWEEEIYYMVATFFDLNRHNPPSPRGEWDNVNFGATMRECKARSDRGGTSSADGKKAEVNDEKERESSIDKRFSALLDSNMETGELAYRLRQFIRLAASKEVGVNWTVLIEDLLRWGDESKRVQKRWARSYYGEQAPTEPVDVPAGEEMDVQG